MAASDITAVVQRGRTVTIGEGTIEVGTGATATRIPNMDVKVAGPGEKITLPAKEMQPLIDHGFVKVEVNPELPASLTAGPKVLQEGKNAPKVTVEAPAEG